MTDERLVSKTFEGTETGQSSLSSSCATCGLLPHLLWVRTVSTSEYEVVPDELVRERVPSLLAYSTNGNTYLRWPTTPTQVARMGSTVVYEDSGTFDDETRYEMIATEIPTSDDYPEGIKYRFQYMDEDGRTVLRFDNFPDHPGVGRHHYHTPDGVYDDIEYTTLGDHVRTFYDEMDARRER